MFSWIFGKKLKNVLYATKKIRIKGIHFEIKKVNILNYLDGSKVLLQSYDIHKTAKSKDSALPHNQKEIEKHYKQVLVAGVKSPALSFEEKDGCILIDDLFIDFEMIEKLYNEIMIFTYGKKKLKQLISVAKNASK